MPDKIKVDVLPQDIGSGVRHCPTQCPLANAINRALGIDDISVSPSNGDGIWYASHRTRLRSSPQAFRVAAGSSYFRCFVRPDRHRAGTVFV